ncbi:MAG: hypothetical protein ABMB14_38550, partial [Myxococcota bacterium]
MLVLWLVGCGAKVPPEAAAEGGSEPSTWFDVEPGKMMCISSVPDAEPLGKKDAAGFAAAVSSIASGEPALATTQLSMLPADHPAVIHAKAVLGVLTGDATAAPALAKFGDDHPTDPCAAAMASIAAATLGDVDRAVAQLQQARTLAPTDPRIAFLSWWLGLEEPAVLVPILEQGLAADPTEVGYGLAIGIDRFEKGDPAAIPMLEAATAAGMEEAAGVLLVAYSVAGERAKFLTLASDVGILADGGAIAKAEDPIAAFAAQLGIADGQTLMATFHTSLGVFSCTLLPEVAPVAVANFVGLARGTRPW